MTISGAEDIASYILSTNADWNEAHAIIGLPPSLDVSLLSGAMELRREAISSTAEIRLTSDEGTLRFNPGTPPVLSIVVGTDRIAGIEPGEYVRDLVIHNGSQRLYGGRGAVTVLLGITRGTPDDGD